MIYGHPRRPSSVSSCCRIDPHRQLRAQRSQSGERRKQSMVAYTEDLFTIFPQGKRGPVKCGVALYMVTVVVLGKAVPIRISREIELVRVLAFNLHMAF